MALDLLNPEALEEYLGIKLKAYQKLILQIEKPVYNFFGGRRCSKKLDSYILLLNKVMYMKDTDKITIVSPNGNKTMAREELLNWLENDYWK